MLKIPFDLDEARRFYPWRIGWRLYDPRRVCYTCGRPRTNSFQDGSPKYSPETCLHEALYDGNPTLDMTPASVTDTLTPAEIVRVRQRAEEIMRIDHERGWSMKHEPPPGETELDVKIRGYAAELVAAKVTGLSLNWDYLPKDYVRAKKRPDIGRRTEVRNTKVLRSYPGEAKSFVYLWVTGRVPTFTVTGWIEGVDLMVPENENLTWGGYDIGPGGLNPLPLPEDA